MLMMTPARRIASLVWPRHVQAVEKINNLPLFAQFTAAANRCDILPDKPALHEHVALSIGDAPIDYFEFGVNTGKALRLWCSTNRHPDSIFHGFDSFEGLPEDWSPRFRKGAFARSSPPDIPDPRLTFEIGWFHETLPGFLRSRFQRHGKLVMHHDADLYGSTLFCLASMDTLLQSGDVLVLDDFANLLHVHRAWRDYRAAFPRSFRLISATLGYYTVVFEVA
jgi:O-methyltransferase